MQGEEIHVLPYYLMLPAAISCSFAFMLPVATPPNAIVFAGGHLQVKDMVCVAHYRNLDHEYSLFRSVRRARRERNPREKKWPRGILGARSQDLAQPFFLAGSFRVSLDRLSERGSTLSL